MVRVDRGIKDHGDVLSDPKMLGSKDNQSIEKQCFILRDKRLKAIDPLMRLKGVVGILKKGGVRQGCMDPKV
jgi:hypothetical protein